MNRQIWEIDYYAEILDLRQENRKLIEMLRAYERRYWWCPVCEGKDYVFSHKDNCPVKEILNRRSK